MSDLNPYEQGLAVDLAKAEARIECLKVENKRLNEQMDAIEEMGTESLNALPDCLMKLAPALVENDELRIENRRLRNVLSDLVFSDGAEFYPGAIEKSSPYCIDFEEWHKEALAVLKGETNDLAKD